jgi:hypothetical protein
MLNYVEQVLVLFSQLNQSNLDVDKLMKRELYMILMNENLKVLIEVLIGLNYIHFLVYEYFLINEMKQHSIKKIKKYDFFEDILKTYI